MAEDRDEGAGRDQVRELLLVPLAALKRPAKTSAADYERLAEQLAYMTPDNLKGLCEFALRISRAGPGMTLAPKCPAPALLRVWAYTLQAPPPKNSDYVASVMRSAMGREAADGGWHVQLLREARRLGPPPGAYLRMVLIQRAEDDRLTYARVRERLQAGLGSDEDRRWMKYWYDDVLLADAMVAEGEARRAAKAARPTA